MEEVADSVVVGQNYTLKDGTPDVRILLFVVMATGYECTPAFQKKVRQCIRDQASHATCLVWWWPVRRFLTP